LRARPEATHLEHILDASFLGKLLVLPANGRLDWKVIATYKHSSLFGLVVSDEFKSFITLTPGDKDIKLLHIHATHQNKLVRLSLIGNSC
jgi:hypothetical protein